MSTFARLLREGAAALNASPTPDLDARVLMMAAAKLDHAQLIANSTDQVPAALKKTYRLLIERRREGVPVAHLTGRQEFFGRPFRVTEDTLIPRPETEMLVEAALPMTPSPQRLLDLGTGTGCLIVTLLCEFPEATGVGVELSRFAAAVTRENAALLGCLKRLEVVEGDFALAPPERFDLIVSNPPYIEEGAELPSSVIDYEPGGALFAGPDGLEAYHILAPLIADRLAPDGMALLEIGTGQGKAVSELMKAAMPEQEISIHHDLAGHERMVKIVSGAV